MIAEIGMRLIYLLLAVVNAHSVAYHGCVDDGDGRFNDRILKHQKRSQQQLVKRSQEGTYVNPPADFRPLTWGDINFVHISDTHGWLGGHLNQDAYSADWGDLTSFITRMKDTAHQNFQDLLVIETGDRHDGTGLSDATEVVGSLSQLIFAQTDIDVISIGNHELYKQSVAEQEYNVLRPRYGASYLGSNVDFQLDDGQWVPAGNRYRIFETPVRRYRVLAFGFIFNFKRFDNGTRVTPVEEALKQDWFQQVIRRNDIDLILVTGHVPVRGFDEYDAIFKAIREVNPSVPIQGFGGHSHVRDFRKFDDNAWALESGRYLETIGWASVKFPSNNSRNTTQFSRKYLDFSPVNFAFHSNTTLNATGPEDKPFQTEQGLAISQMVSEYRKKLNLNKKFGEVPQDYLTDRAPYPSNCSLLTHMENDILPLLKGNVSRDDQARYIITNTGNFRYDLFKGTFTEDTKYVVSPFSNDWLYVRDLDIEKADLVMAHLNKKGAGRRKRSLLDLIRNSTSTTSAIPEPPEPTAVYVPPVRNKSSSTRVFKGYSSTDDLDDEGDDTPHEGYTFYDIPNAIVAKVNVSSSTKTVDLTFVSYLKPQIEKILKDFNEKFSVELYGGSYVRELAAEYYSLQ